MHNWGTHLPMWPFWQGLRFFAAENGSANTVHFGFGKNVPGLGLGLGLGLGPGHSVPNGTFWGEKIPISHFRMTLTISGMFRDLLDVFYGVPKTFSKRPFQSK